MIPSNDFSRFAEFESLRSCRQLPASVTSTCVLGRWWTSMKTCSGRKTGRGRIARDQAACNHRFIHPIACSQSRTRGRKQRPPDAPLQERSSAAEEDGNCMLHPLFAFRWPRQMRGSHHHYHCDQITNSNGNLSSVFTERFQFII